MKDRYKETLSSLVKSIHGSAESVDADSLCDLVDLILSKKTIFIYGSGRSGLVGQYFAVRLVQLGLDVHFGVIGVARGKRCGKLLSGHGLARKLCKFGKVERASTAAIFCAVYETEIIVKHFMVGVSLGYSSGSGANVFLKALVERTTDLGRRARGKRYVFLESGGLIQLPTVTDGGLDKYA